MRIVYLLFLGLFLVSCQQKNHSDLYLEAEFTHVKDGTPVYVGAISEGNKIAKPDTVLVKKGKVILDLPPLEEPQLYVLDLEKPNGKKRLFFIHENLPVKYQIYADSLSSSIVSGGEMNKTLQDYQSDINLRQRELRKMENSYSEKELQTPRVKKQLSIKQKELDNRNTAFRREFLKNNHENLPSLVVFSDLIETQTMTVGEMRRIYNTFPKELKNTDFGKHLGQTFTNTDPLAIGNIAPSFSAPTPDGKELALEDALGKYTLVDFWAAWCLPCRRENPNLVRVYEMYKDQGFTILGVSFDREREKWLKAIEDDGLEWNQISNLSFWNDPIARQYRIRSIPSSILLDEEGRIIAKNLRGKALEFKIRDLLKEE